MITRRHFLAGACGMLGPNAVCTRAEEAADKALVAISLDLEMSRNFPTWEQTHWDYAKGDLDDATKRYSVEAARRIATRGGRIHFFAVGRVFEQENVNWLQEIAGAGHPIGNHTYDHVNVRAREPKELQFRFQRAPWLIHNQRPEEVIRENIHITNLALKERLGIQPAGFRTPGGFASGLEDRPDLQQMLLDFGFRWISSKYPGHTIGPTPTETIIDSIVAAQKEAQPFVYPTGLIEVPMSPISDIGAFRNGRWKLDGFLHAIQKALDWSIENRAVFDFLGHPSCLLTTDPGFAVFDLICKTVEAAGAKAAFANLDDLSRRAKKPKG